MINAVNELPNAMTGHVSIITYGRSMNRRRRRLGEMRCIVHGRVGCILMYRVAPIR